MKFFFTLFLLILILPPSVSAQRRTYFASSECRKVVSIDLGAHRVFVDGPIGGHFGFNIESIVSEKFTFNFNAKDFVNEYSGFTIEQGIVEQRLAFIPSVSFYPRIALHGFYMNAGCGGFVYINNRENTMAGSNESFLKLLPEVKVGFQSIAAYNFAWNVYVGSGVFIPKKLFDAIPMFEMGVKLGMKL